MNGARVLVLVVALAAGGGAAYLMMKAEDPLPVAPATAPAPVSDIETVDVLVANGAIEIGQTIGPQAMRWQAWPKTAASSIYILKADKPRAVEELAGSTARASLADGEPIREEKMIKGNGSGYLAAVLPAGMRAIATPISPETGAGGFILPNDRVDVLLLRTQKSGGGEAYVAQTLLTNVRVLAIDQTVEEKNGQRVVVGKTATLALTPRNAETLALGTRLGTIALALRSLTDAQAGEGSPGETDSRTSINVVRFGQSTQLSR
jgi:pilus assembly protein CpaB